MADNLARSIDARTATSVDPETRVHDAHHDALRLWLRLFTCSQLFEREIRRRLRRDLGTTLPRFDFMAQLERYPQGLKMGELSQRLLVTGGNVTGIADQLVAEGLVERAPIPGDRRATAVRLTGAGKARFDAMAAVHEGWVVELLVDVSAADRTALYALLGRLKKALQSRENRK